ncbi:MAG: LamG-like jellyroll fold domain-containing protein [Candidatus Dormibacteria bacterium]
MAEALVNDAPVALAAAITSTQTTVTRASNNTGWPGDASGPPSANFRLNVSDGTNQELMLVTGGQGTTTLTVTRAVEPIGGQQASFAFTTATMTPTITAGGLAATQPTASSIVGGQQLVPVGPGGSGLKIVSGGFGVWFDGLVGQLLTPYSVLASAGTVMFWVNPGRDLTQNNGPFWLDNSGNAAIQQLAGTPLNVVITQATTSANFSDTVTLSSLASAWHLFVLTFTSSSAQLYRDGTLVASQTGLSGSPTGPAAPMAWGAGTVVGVGASGIQGTMAHCAFWLTTVLTAAEISALYSNASSMTESAYESYVVSLAPTLYYPMQENTGTVATNKGSTGSTDNANYGGNYILGMPGPIGGQPTLMTSPPAPTGAIVITSGTAYQNTAPYDVMLRIPVAYAAGTATLAVGVGPTSSPTQVTEVSRGSTALAETLTTTVYLPASWYLLLTATGATLGNATSQPV